MNVSCPSVHPVAVASVPAAGGVIVVPIIRMKNVEGMPATLGGLCLRALQFLFAALSLVFLASTLDFLSITAYNYLVFAMSLQSSWSLSMGVVDVYALLVRRSLHNASLIRLFTIGDGITSTLTFTAACASAGITILITNDLDRCADNPCLRLEAATAMAFLSWFAESPSFLLNYWSLASR